MLRTLRGVIAAGFLGAVLVVANSGLAADEPGKCALATKGESPVAKACAQGGIKEAKKAMKDLIKKAKAAGVKFDCDDCHADDAKYDVLTDDAKDKFKKLLAAAEGKK